MVLTNCDESKRCLVARAPRGSICISQASGRGLAGRRLMMKSPSAPRPNKDAWAGIADILLQTQNDECHVHPYKFHWQPFFCSLSLR